MTKRSAKHYHKAGIRVADRPWSVLSAGQRELRLDTVAWHEREIFLDEILKHASKLTRLRAERSTQLTMQLLVRAFKRNVDLGDPKVTEHELAKLERSGRGFDHLPKQVDGEAVDHLISSANPSPVAAPALGGTFADLDALIARAAGKPFTTPRPSAAEREQAARQERRQRQPGPAQEAGQEAAWQGGQEAQQGSQEAPGQSGQEPLHETLSSAPGYRAAAKGQAERVLFGDDPAGQDEQGAAPPPPPPPRAEVQAEIELIRSKLMRNGKARLDVEALAAYLLCPSYFAIATNLNPEPWQSQVLDSYARRLGVLASRQCGKSIIIARKVVAFSTCSPGSTTLILAPTLRQSSELLLKISGVCHIAGLKLATLNQFSAVFAEKQPGAASRIVCLPGSNEDSGASARGYSADLLVLEEASFLADPVIMSVLPSIAARPKAQLIGISSAGIVGSYFHSVMTSSASRWVKMIIPAALSGRFSQEQLAELRLTLGARYAVEMQCAWGSIGDSIFGEDTMQTAFGTASLDPAFEPEVDPESAFAHLDLETLFAAQPFAPAPFVSKAA